MMNNSVGPLSEKSGMVLFHSKLVEPVGRVLLSCQLLILSRRSE